VDYGDGVNTMRETVIKYLPQCQRQTPDSTPSPTAGKERSLGYLYMYMHVELLICCLATTVLTFLRLLGNGFTHPNSVFLDIATFVMDAVVIITRLEELDLSQNVLPFL